jgi:hypothetical protein
MKLTYKSAGGIVEMGGGTHPLINIIQMSGFGIPTKEYETVTFVSENGVTTIGEKDLPRTITITGDLLGGQLEIMNALKSFYYKGELYCDFGKIRRKIACKCTNLEDMERHQNSGINTFTVQLQCDYPYFSDWNDTVQSLASYKNLVTDTFTLPCVFTQMLQEGKIYNNGDKYIYPTITISANQDNTTEDNVIHLVNHTTGAEITINHTMRNGEDVTLNLATRQITSNIDGRITNHVSDDTILSNFFLDVGENKISFATSDTKQPLTARIIYNRIYLMAVR